ncbi:heme-dependent oxidative N-demethylase family protein [Stappia taiwanensis]|uniref:heme-dependent oxidative N-demethylase family protein n=1 Tax=Stappia taiwanensis TaxID=992267 RepID=UPI001FCF1D80|nr:DUF3445 domain-containing protein [Stappia taiwanensis]
MRVAPPFAHTPYDGSARPFSVGLLPLDLADWIEPDTDLAAHLAEKERLLQGGAEAPVLVAEADTLKARREVLSLLLDHLPATFPELYWRTGETIRILPMARDYRLADWQDRPLELAARLVQEDLALMRRSPRGYRLVAAALCFPSSWSLAEKFGGTMRQIHETVPGFNDGRMGPMVARIFDNLAVDRPSWRLNWSLYTGPALHRPVARRLDDAALDVAPSKSEGMDTGLHVRVERQTLRRLPESGDILFTIKVHHDPVAAFAAHPDGARLVAGLRAQLLALDTAQLAYKGLAEQRDRIAERLAALGQTGTGHRSERP